MKVVRTAVYARVSTDMDIQKSSLEEQMKSFRAKIDEHPGWVLVDVYADEGISGTRVKHRKAFLRMIKDCEDGKVDYILAKSISRFARNTVEACTMCGTCKVLAFSCILKRKTSNGASASDLKKESAAGRRHMDIGSMRPA